MHTILLSHQDKVAAFNFYFEKISIYGVSAVM